jgi:hypothetical protein
LFDTQIVTERTSILKALNQHILDAGSLYEKVKCIIEPPMNLPDTPVQSFTRFSFSSFSVSEVCKALKEIDGKTFPGPDELDPHLLHLAADIIAPP